MRLKLCSPTAVSSPVPAFSPVSPSSPSSSLVSSRLEGKISSKLKKHLCGPHGAYKPSAGRVRSRRLVGERGFNRPRAHGRAGAAFSWCHHVVTVMATGRSSSDINPDSCSLAACPSLSAKFNYRPQNSSKPSYLLSPLARAAAGAPGWKISSSLGVLLPVFLDLGKHRPLLRIYKRRLVPSSPSTLIQQQLKAHTSQLPP